jgi:two-component system chemotaxis sensor kinase CheA
MGKLNPGNLPTLTALFPILDGVAQAPGVPTALVSQCNRVKLMVESAIMGETPMDSTLSKLREVLNKMVSSLGKLAPTEEARAEEKPAPSADVPEYAPAALDLDLINKFISNQRLQLDDFEAFVLEMEKGNGAAREEVRRYLHTLKGEFGVLDLPEYSELVHFIEDSFLSGRLNMDHMFRFKDWLLSVFPALSAGTPVRLRESDYAQFGIQLDAPTEKEVAKAASQPESKAKAGLDASFVVDFINESREHLHVIETRIMDLEGDPTSEDPLHSVFRACHTIKGLAGFLDQVEIQKLAHAMESLMDKARNRLLTLTMGHTDLLLACSDCIKELVVRVEASLANEDHPVPANFHDLLKKLSDLDLSGAPAPLAATPTARVGEILVNAGLVSPVVVDRAISKQKQGDERKIGEILMTDDGVSPRTLGQALGSQVQAKQQTQLQGVEESVRVPVARLDQLIDAIGEAVIAQSMIVADPVIVDVHRPITPEDREDMRRKVARAEVIMRQIQELSMALRMVSVKAMFQKMARLVRDLSKKLDKRVEFIMEGENTELDKSVVENIGDPLVHMVRNSLDHGIETTEQRLAAGKSDVAKVTLRAYHKGGSVFIEIQDDGRGLSRERIVKKAIENGIITSGDSMSDSEVWNLIFRPGFSTAEKVTDVSGRGVGMDVVRRNIESLRGTCEIASKAGEGSLFTIRLPLTLAIIDGMVIRAGTERYIIPTLSIQTTVRPEKNQLSTVTGKGEILNLRGELIRLVRLDSVFKIDGARKSEVDGVVLVVEDAMGKKAGILVDEIMDQQQVVIKNLGSMGNIPGVTGGAIMNDGTVALIIDVGGVVRSVSE